VERTEKREFVTSMKSELADAGAVVVAHYAGLTVADMSALRIQMKEAGGTVKVAKNRLVKLLRAYRHWMNYAVNLLVLYKHQQRKSYVLSTHQPLRLHVLSGHMLQRAKLREANVSRGLLKVWTKNWNWNWT